MRKMLFVSLVCALSVMANVAYAADFTDASPMDIALYPQQNAIRNRLDLSGIWSFQLDPKEEGEVGAKNRITIMVENKLRPDRVPGNVAGGALASQNYPNANYDFFPYSGLHRAVWLYSVPKAARINDITLTTTFSGTVGKIHAKVQKVGSVSVGRIVVADRDGRKMEAQLRFKGQEAEADVQVPGHDDLGFCRFPHQSGIDACQEHEPQGRVHPRPPTQDGCLAFKKTLGGGEERSVLKLKI